MIPFRTDGDSIPNDNANASTLRNIQTVSLSPYSGNCVQTKSKSSIGMVAPTSLSDTLGDFFDSTALADNVSRGAMDFTPLNTHTSCDNYTKTMNPLPIPTETGLSLFSQSQPRNDDTCQLRRQSLPKSSGRLLRSGSEMTSHFYDLPISDSNHFNHNLVSLQGQGDFPSDHVSTMDQENELVRQLTPVIDIRCISSDDDMPDDDHIDLLIQANLNYATSMYFSNENIRGIVVFSMNENVKFTSVQEEDIAIHVENTASALQHDKQRIADNDIAESWNLVMKRYVTGWKNKCAGGKVPIPALKGPKTLSFVFTASFIQLLVLFGIDAMSSSTESYIQVGTAGSNAASYFSLTSAPSSQPRSLIFSHILALVIGISTRMSERFVPKYVRTSFAGATNTMMMAYFGTTSPSASALATKSAGDATIKWQSIVYITIQNIIAVILSTCINNLSNKRQYPTMKWADMCKFRRRKVK